MKGGGKLGNTIRLNLKAVSDLLSRKVRHFSELTENDRAELSRRFIVYCEHGTPDFSPGLEANEAKGIEESPPILDHLPCKDALAIAKR